jgi:hypothetical protein
VTDLATTLLRPGRIRFEKPRQRLKLGNVAQVAFRILDEDGDLLTGQSVSATARNMITGAELPLPITVDDDAVKQVAKFSPLAVGRYSLVVSVNGPNIAAASEARIIVDPSIATPGAGGGGETPPPTGGAVIYTQPTEPTAPGPWFWIPTAPHPQAGVSFFYKPAPGGTT